MSLPRYAEYKDSGVAFVGKVPTLWDVVPLSYICEVLQTGPFGSQLHSGEYVENGVPVINPSNIVDGRLLPDPSCSVSEVDAQRLAQHQLKSGDIVVGRRGEMGRCAVVPDEAAGWLCGTGSLKVRLKCQAAPKFVSAYLRTPYVREVLSLESVGSTMENLNAGILGQVRVPLPSIAEQSAIVAFLDGETAKIDALIAEQEKLITLLAEKRQATISHAVTKGLNPNVPMKDSGVAWLGEVPAHWEVKSFRHILDAIGDVDHFMPASVESGVPYLMTGDLKDFLSDVRLDDCKQVSRHDYLELSKRIKSSKGDVVMARYATIGTSMYVDVDVDFLVSYSCVTLKVNSSKVSGIYLFQYVGSDAFRQGIEGRINTNTQGNVGIKDLQGVKIPVPPVDEQAIIANHLGSEIKKLDLLDAESARAIALLKERRSVLIAAAVTGQIDVRDVSLR